MHRETQCEIMYAVENQYTYRVCFNRSLYYSLEWVGVGMPKEAYDHEHKQRQTDEYVSQSTTYFLVRSSLFLHYQRTIQLYRTYRQSFRLWSDTEYLQG